MKLLLATGVLLSSPASAFANQQSVVCDIEYRSPKNRVSLNTVEVIRFPGVAETVFYTSKVFGSLRLEVGLGGIATDVERRRSPVLSIFIFDSQFGAPQAGGIAATERESTKVEYMSDDKAHLTAECRLTFD